MGNSRGYNGYHIHLVAVNISTGETRVTRPSKIHRDTPWPSSTGCPSPPLRPLWPTWSGFHGHGGSPKCTVYSGKLPWKWMIFRGIPVLGHLQLEKLTTFWPCFFGVEAKFWVGIVTNWMQVHLQVANNAKAVVIRSCGIGVSKALDWRLSLQQTSAGWWFPPITIVGMRTDRKT